MKNLKSLGEVLDKKTQKAINGGARKHRCGPSVPQIAMCTSNSQCPQGQICCPLGNCSY